MSDEPRTSSTRNSKLGHRKLWLLSALLVALTLLGLVFIRNLIDFPVYYAAGRSLIEGRTDLYSPDFALGRVMDYRYPPFFLIALVPLWLIPYPVAAYVWYVLSVFEIIGCVVIVTRAFPALRESKAMWLLVGLAVGQYFVMALHYGNAHLLAIFLLFASFHFFLKQRNLAAAALLSLAISIKLTPILILTYFALKKRWTLLIGVFVFLIAINLAPSVYFGVRGNGELLATWYRHVVASQTFHEYNGPINLSLKGQLQRYLSQVDYSERVDGDVEYPAVSFGSVSRERADELWAVISGVLLLSVLLLIWRKTQPVCAIASEDLERNTRHEIVALEIGLMICVMLLIGPLTSKLYFIALLWPVACLASFATRAKTTAARLSMRVLLIVALANSVLPLLPGRSVQRLLLVLGADFYVNCLVMATLICVLVSRCHALQAQSSEPQTRVLSEARTP